MKKLVTLILVLVMLVSILVIPAMATEIQPRYPAMRCECGGYAVYCGISPDGYQMFECSTCGHIYAYQHVG